MKHAPLIRTVLPFFSVYTVISMHIIKPDASFSLNKLLGGHYQQTNNSSNSTHFQKKMVNTT